MENIFNNNNISINKIENEEPKRSGPSEFALSLRKKKINQIVSKTRILEQKNPSEKEFGKNELKKLCDLSKALYEEKDHLKVNEILDKLYFFFINFKEPIKTNYIDISSIIQNLYTIMILFKDREMIISKSFDVFDQIIRLTPSQYPDKFYRIFYEQYCQILYELIDFYQNNKNIIEKIFNFITILIQKSEKIKEYLMTKTGFYFIQTIFSLDTKYPQPFIKLLASFCSLIRINEINMKEFQTMFLEECDKIISLFYEENHIDPKNVINNSYLFKNLYKCLSFISQSINDEIIDRFFVVKKNDISLYEKIMILSQFDKDLLSLDLIKITGNLFCSNEKEHIQILIDCKSYQYIMNMLLQQFNDNEIISNVAWALSNFINNNIYRKIFIKENYFNGLILILKNNNSFDVINEILNLISSLFDASKEDEMISFFGNEMIKCFVELLLNLKEPNLLIKILNIIQILLLKGDPNLYVNCYYKNSDDKITNIYKYQFDNYGLYDILCNIASNNNHKTVTNIVENIINHFYFNANKIIID